MMISALSFPFLALVQFLCSAVPLHGKFQDHIEGLRGGKYHQHRGNALGVYVLGLGVAGVAIPSLISRAVAGFILYHLLKNPSNEVHLLKERFHIDWPVIHKIFT